MAPMKRTSIFRRPLARPGMAGLALALALGPAGAEALRQAPGAVAQAAQEFVLRQTQSLPGRVSVQVGGLDERLILPACGVLEPFLPPGQRLWGNASVGVRCTAPSAWTVYLPVTVRVEAQVLAAARPLAPGTQLSEADLTPVAADLTQLSAAVVSDPRDILGKTVAAPIAAGQLLRSDQLKATPVVMQGQTVKVIARGRGFSVSAEGRSLSSAAEGQLVQVRLAGGQLVSGIARPGAVVEVTH
jgi:flagella basal body P-ring formation protein FlgA